MVIELKITINKLKNQKDGLRNRMFQAEIEYRASKIKMETLNLLTIGIDEKDHNR